MKEVGRLIDEAEKEIEVLEANVRQLTQLLEDPQLYTSREGTERSLTLGKELEDAKRKLDAALETWTDRNSCPETAHPAKAGVAKLRA